jgi:hypothetical protein
LEVDKGYRSEEMDRQLQLIAKYRQWIDGRGGPWEGSSDQRVPDMAESSQRAQDTIHNAVMSTRPVVTSRAVKKADKDKQELIDDLHDTQFFVEQNGERVVEEAAECFVNDPTCVIEVNWVDERRQTVDTVPLEAIPEGKIPSEVFGAAIRQQWPQGAVRQTDDEGWDYEVKIEGTGRTKPITVKFYTDADGVQMVIRDPEVLVYEGPRATVVGWENVYTPPRVANLQIPGPSNRGGAPHVILLDKLTVDEVKRHQASGYYNLMTKEESTAVAQRAEDTDDSEIDRLKDAAGGKQEERKPDDAQQGRVTLLKCYDIYDMDGDGVAEDVIFWVLLEPKLLVKVKPLAEAVSADRPMRPLAEGCYMPVAKRREGISLLEFTEGLHDWEKKMIDHMVDAGDLTTTPTGSYRAASTINPEVVRRGPGELMPLANPKEDVVWDKIDNSALPYSLNTVALIQQKRERLTLQGDLQAGRVPAGKSSALRTLGGVQTILAQGEARPERILRRFFMMWTQVYQIMYQLNKRRLPENKEFAIAGYVEPNKDPFRKVPTRADIDGNFQFDFHANAFNSSKGAALQSLQEFGAVAITPLSVQMGIVRGEELYRYERDLGKAFGMDPDKYLHPPSPESTRPRISFEDAIDMIMSGGVPDGLPAEGAIAQFEKLKVFMADDEQYGLITDPAQVDILRQYAEMLGQLAQNEQRMIEQVRAASAQGAGRGNGATPQPQNPGGLPPVGPGELVDEQIEGAGSEGQF